MKRGGRENRKALAWTLLGMILCALLLETRGLLAWSARLEVGDLSTLANEATAGLAAVTEQTHIPAVRSALLELVATNKPESMPPQGNPAAPEPEIAAASQATPSAPQEENPLDVVAMTAIEPASAPVAASSPAASQGDAGSTEVTVVLVGDSMMAVGLGPYLTRQLSSSSRIRVVRAYRSGTGLARPEVFNWQEQYPKMLGDAHADLIVCAIGANDAQNFMLDGKPVAFGSEKWVEEYQRRVMNLVDAVAPNQTPMLWLALPSMRNGKYARRVFQLNALVREKLSQRGGITWVEANPLLGGGEKTYVEYQKNRRQKLERLRQPDGIHLSDAGAARVGQAVVAWVKQYLDQSRLAQGSSTKADL